MTALKNHKVLAAPFGNEIARTVARYSFADDGGATGVYVAFTAQGDLVIEDVYLSSKLLPTSLGSATVSVGRSDDGDGYIDSVAKATLVAGYLAVPALVEGTPNTRPLPAKLADGDTIGFSIEAAALTAGILDVIVKYSRL